MEIHSWIQNSVVMRRENRKKMPTPFYAVKIFFCDWINIRNWNWNEFSISKQVGRLVHFKGTMSNLFSRCTGGVCTLLIRSWISRRWCPACEMHLPPSLPNVEPLRTHAHSWINLIWMRIDIDIVEIVDIFLLSCRSVLIPFLPFSSHWKNF